MFEPPFKTTTGGGQQQQQQQLFMCGDDAQQQSRTCQLELKEGLLPLQIQPSQIWHTFVSNYVPDKMKVAGFWTSKKPALVLLHVLSDGRGPSLFIPIPNEDGESAKEGGLTLKQFYLKHLQIRSCPIVLLSGGLELILCAVPERGGVDRVGSFWGFICTQGAAGLISECVLDGKLPVVFDLDETLIQAHSLKSLETRLQKAENEGEMRSMEEDLTLLREFQETDTVELDGIRVEADFEKIKVNDGQSVSERPIIRFEHAGLVFTRIDPLHTDTSMLFRPRPGWRTMHEYIVGKTESKDGKARLRYQGYVCTTAERQYALEAWRILDQRYEIIPLDKVVGRVVCVSATRKKRLAPALHLTNNPGNFSRMREHLKVLRNQQDAENPVLFSPMPIAVILDDRTDVWEEEVHRQIMPISAFNPYQDAPSGFTPRCAQALQQAQSVTDTMLQKLIAIRKVVFWHINEILVRQYEKVLKQGLPPFEQLKDAQELLGSVLDMGKLLNMDAGQINQVIQKRAGEELSEDGSQPSLKKQRTENPSLKPIDPRKLRAQNTKPTKSAPASISDLTNTLNNSRNNSSDDDSKAGPPSTANTFPTTANDIDNTVNMEQDSTKQQVVIDESKQLLNNSITEDKKGKIVIDADIDNDSSIVMDEVQQNVEVTSKTRENQPENVGNQDPNPQVDQQSELEQNLNEQLLQQLQQQQQQYQQQEQVQQVLLQNNQQNIQNIQNVQDLQSQVLPRQLVDSQFNLAGINTLENQIMQQQETENQQLNLSLNQIMGLNSISPANLLPLQQNFPQIDQTHLQQQQLQQQQLTQLQCAQQILLMQQSQQQQQQLITSQQQMAGQQQQYPQFQGFQTTQLQQLQDLQMQIPGLQNVGQSFGGMQGSQGGGLFNGLNSIGGIGGSMQGGGILPFQGYLSQFQSQQALFDQFQQQEQQQILQQQLNVAGNAGQAANEQQQKQQQQQQLPTQLDDVTVEHLELVLSTGEHPMQLMSRLCAQFHLKYQFKEEVQRSNFTKHAPKEFCAKLLINEKYVATGKGSNKKAARKEAALATIRELVLSGKVDIHKVEARGQNSQKIQSTPPPKNSATNQQNNDVIIIDGSMINNKKLFKTLNNQEQDKSVALDQALYLLDWYFGPAVQWKDTSRSKNENSFSIEASVELQDGEYFDKAKVLAWDQDHSTAQCYAALKIFQLLGFQIDKSQELVVSKQVQVVDRPTQQNWRQFLPALPPNNSTKQHYSDDDGVTYFRPRSSPHRSSSAKGARRGQPWGSGSAGRSEAHLPPKKKKNSREQRWLKKGEEEIDMQTYYKRQEIYIKQCQNYISNMTDALDDDGLGDYDDQEDVPPHLRKEEEQGQEQGLVERMGEELGTESTYMEEDFIPLDSGDDEEEGEIKD